MEGTAEVNGVNLWYASPARASRSCRSTARASATSTSTQRRQSCRSTSASIDYDMRGYGARTGRFRTTTWRCGPTTSRGSGRARIDQAHVHGTSMGGMIAIVFAGKYPERTTSVVINCAAAKLGVTGRPIFKNWIDIARLDPDGPGSRILAELITWQALSKGFLEEPTPRADDLIQQILRDSNRIEVFTAACQAMCDMDLRDVAAEDHRRRRSCSAVTRTS